MESSQHHEEKAPVPSHDNPSETAAHPTSRDGVSAAPEVVKDIDELIAAMGDVDESSPAEEDDAPDSEEPAPSEKAEPAPEVVEDSEEIKAAKERLAQIKPKILTLKWDMDHGQINPAKKALYERLRPEYDKLIKVVEDSGQKA